MDMQQRVLLCASVVCVQIEGRASLLPASMFLGSSKDIPRLSRIQYNEAKVVLHCLLSKEMENFLYGIIPTGQAAGWEAGLLKHNICLEQLPQSVLHCQGPVSLPFASTSVDYMSCLEE